MSCVLIVDDDKVTAELLSASLEKEGFQVESCNDGTIGMAQVRNRPPNLLILDLGLPGIPGLEILEAIRNSPQLNALPIIVVTVRDEEADAVMGADDYIVKPVRPRELVARVKRLLRRSQRPDREAKRIEIGDFIIDPGSLVAQWPAPGHEHVGISPSFFPGVPSGPGLFSHPAARRSLGERSFCHRAQCGHIHVAIAARSSGTRTIPFT